VMLHSYRRCLGQSWTLGQGLDIPGHVELSILDP